MPLTTTGDALLQAIIDEPDKDDLRLIYADWLEDHGEEDRRDLERAAFIRTQIELEAKVRERVEIQREGECKECERTGRISGTLVLACLRCRNLTDDISALVYRQDELIRFNAWRWLRDDLPTEWGEYFNRFAYQGGFILPRHDESNAVEFRRGFVHTVSLPTALWLQHRVELVLRHPIQRVELTDREAALCVASDGEDIDGKYRWSRFLGGEDGETTHYIGGDLIPRRTDMNQSVWSIHDTPEEADAWLSAKLIARAKELAAEGRREEVKTEE